MYRGKETQMGIETGIEIISKENIKPASPTPEHLRTYKVSILDQLHPHIYVPMVYFYPNNNPGPGRVDLGEIRHCLKQSLSETLSGFYPLAGTVKDGQHIECNDEGVYYVEARVRSCNLSDFLSQQIPAGDYELLHRLLPFHPSHVDSLGKNYVAMVQVDIFDCGGIAIGLYTSHKIIDGQSHMTFMKAWAAVARGSSSENIIPSFISPSVFLPDSSLPEDASIAMWPAAKQEQQQRKNVTRRFVFDADSLSALRLKIDAPCTSRFMAVTALIWKCAIAASKVKSGRDKPSVLSFAVNLRARRSPPLPSESIGNIVWSAIAECTSPQTHDDGLEALHSVVGNLKNAISKVKSNFGEGCLKVKESLNKLREIYSEEDAEYVAVTSWCNGGIYEADFGWGKPIWACIGNAGADIPVLINFVFLMDTRSGDGVEAWVTLDEQDMAILEHHPHILTFASLNPTPLPS